MVDPNHQYFEPKQTTDAGPRFSVEVDSASVKEMVSREAAKIAAKDGKAPAHGAGKKPDER